MREEPMGRTTATDIRSYIDELSASVIERWRANDFRREAFPEVASECLAVTPPRESIDLGQLTRWIMFSDQLPFQQHFGSSFGEPSVTLFWHPRFYIEALHWMTSTPAIHNHAFHGAFTVLHGSSLHTEYDFHCERAVTDVLQFGELKAQQSQRIEPGVTIGVNPGKEFIHSVFHLETPSVTLVVRTHSEPDKSSRFEYLPPGVAFDRTVEDQAQTRRLQILQLLHQSNPAQYYQCASELLQATDVFQSFLVVRQAILELNVSGEIVANLVSQFRRRWEADADMVHAALLEARRRNKAISLRARIVNPEQRVLLGLLLAQLTWPDVRAALSERWSGEELASGVIRMLGDLSAASVPVGQELAERLRHWTLDASLEALPADARDLSDRARKSLRALASLPQFGSMFR